MTCDQRIVKELQQGRRRSRETVERVPELRTKEPLRTMTELFKIRDWFAAIFSDVGKAIKLSFKESDANKKPEMKRRVIDQGREGGREGGRRRGGGRRRRKIGRESD